MKTKLATGLITLVIALGVGGYWYFSQTAPLVSTSALATTTKNVASDWKTYVNSQHGYTISYPSNIYQLEDMSASACVVLRDGSTVDDSTWYISIMDTRSVQGPDTHCGASAPSNFFSTTTDTINLEGKQFTADGYARRATIYFRFTLRGYLLVEYGMAPVNGLSDQDYQAALDSIHAILSTLGLDPNFIPSGLPANG